MGRKVLVGTIDGLHEIDDRKHTRLAGHEVTSQAHYNGNLWVILDQREVWRSSAGREWMKAVSIENLKANCLLPTAGGLFVGTSAAHLFVIRAEVLEAVRSFDEAPGREEWFTPWGGPPDVRSMSVAPSGTIYVNVHVGGILRSADEGRTWQPTIKIDADVHQVLYDPDSELLLAATSYGLAISNDDGKNWLFEAEGLHGKYLRAVAVSDRTVLVTASTGPSTNQAAVYRKSLDSHKPFQRCSQGLPDWFSDNIDTFCLASSGAWVVFGTTEGHLFLSADGGESWDLMAEGLPSVECVTLI